MTRRIVLLRHARTGEQWTRLWVGGGTDAEADPSCLAELGRSLEGYKASNPPERVLSSPLRRATATAALVSNHVEIEPRLAERHFGEWEGRPVEECLVDVAPEFLGSIERWLDLPIPGAEAPQVVAQRVSAVVGELRRHPARVTWCVAHAGTIRLMIACVRGVSLAEAFQIEVPHALPIELELD